MKLNEFTKDELERYKKALKELLERYINNKDMVCPLCNITHNVVWRMSEYHDRDENVCNYCIWSSYYNIEDYDDFDLCTEVYQDKFEEFSDFYRIKINESIKNYRVKEVKQWIGDINAINKKR